MFCVLNNLFELRSDAWKIAIQTSRALPIREDSIGPWSGMLLMISWLGVVLHPLWGIVMGNADLHPLYLLGFVFLFEQIFIIANASVKAMVAQMPNDASSKLHKQYLDAKDSVLKALNMQEEPHSPAVSEKDLSSIRKEIDSLR